MEGYEDPFCRDYFKWDKVTDDNPFLAFYRSLAQMRNENEVLQKGDVRADTDGEGRLYIYREYKGAKVCAAINTADAVEIPVPGEVLFDRRADIKDGKAWLSQYGIILFRA